MVELAKGTGVSNSLHSFSFKFHSIVIAEVGGLPLYPESACTPSLILFSSAYNFDSFSGLFITSGSKDKLSGIIRLIFSILKTSLSFVFTFLTVIFQFTSSVLDPSRFKASSIFASFIFSFILLFSLFILPKTATNSTHFKHILQFGPLFRFPSKLFVLLKYSSL